MSNYPVMQPSAGVPAPRGLIFEPTEIMANRLIDAEEEGKTLRRRLTWSRLMTVILFFMLITACAAVAFVWWSSQQEVARSQAAVAAVEQSLEKQELEFVTLGEQRDQLRDYANSLEEYEVAQRAADDLNLEKQDFLQLTKWYLENDIGLPDDIMARWYPGGETDSVLEAIKAAITAGAELPPLDTLRIKVGSDGWRERGEQSLIADRTELESASTKLRNRTARLAAAADKPPPPRPERKATPY